VDERHSEPVVDDAGAGRRHVGLKKLLAYRVGELAAAEREAVQEHLSLCARCSRLLLELREFDSAVAGGEAGPEALREATWESLVRRLPESKPVLRPLAGGARPKPDRPRRRSPLLVSAAAALLLAIAGLAGWALWTVRQERGRLAVLQERLGRREADLAALETALAGKDELAAQVAELTATVEALRRAAATARAGVAVAVSPRFVLRGEQPSETGVLRGGGEANTVPMPREGDRLMLTLGLPDSAAYAEYRHELLDRGGKVLWSGRRPGRSVLGDAGTSVAVTGLGPGLYRLRVEGVSPERTELLGEYVLEVVRAPSDG
jgi:anti-sigma factor RsiW